MSNNTNNLAQNLEDLADRFEMAIAADYFSDPPSFRDFTNILRDLAQGRPGNDLADVLDLPTEFPEEV